jgi:hypothetical protein
LPVGRAFDQVRERGPAALPDLPHDHRRGLGDLLQGDPRIFIP